jgi:two-component system copper resistance phosphate regulon response regulator CusR
MPIQCSSERDLLPDRLLVANLIIDLDKREVKRGNTVLYLNKKEFLLLKYLVDHRNSIVLKTDLIRNIWKRKIRPDTLCNCMISLRKKIDGSFAPRLIYTATGKGYILLENAGF